MHVLVLCEEAVLSKILKNFKQKKYPYTKFAFSFSGQKLFSRV